MTTLYQLTRNDEVLIAAAPFNVVWRMTIEHYGHMTLKEFHDAGMMIAKA